MKPIHMVCSNCSGTMVSENHGAFTSISCPYCGNNLVLIESDRVKVAQMRTDTERMRMSLGYQERRDDQNEARIILRIRIGIICVFMMIILVLVCLFVRQISGGYLF